MSCMVKERPEGNASKLAPYVWLLKGEHLFEAGICLDPAKARECSLLSQILATQPNVVDEYGKKLWDITFEQYEVIAHEIKEKKNVPSGYTMGYDMMMDMAEFHVEPKGDKYEDQEPEFIMTQNDWESLLEEGTISEIPSDGEDDDAAEYDDTPVIFSVDGKQITVYIEITC